MSDGEDVLPSALQDKAGSTYCKVCKSYINKNVNKVKCKLCPVTLHGSCFEALCKIFFISCNKESWVCKNCTAINVDVNTSELSTENLYNFVEAFTKPLMDEIKKLREEVFILKKAIFNFFTFIPLNLLLRTKLHTKFEMSIQATLLILLHQFLWQMISLPL